jgi:Tfp pilus assembly protein PilV
MKGVSSIFAIILILMLGVSITGLAYFAFSKLSNQMTTSTQGTISNTLVNMLAQMKISITNDTVGGKTMVYITNTGKVDLTNFSAYVNEVIVSPADLQSVLGDKIIPGDIGNLNITNSMAPSGSTVKITTAQGAMAIQAVP